MDISRPRRLDPIVADYLARTPWRLILRDQVLVVAGQLAGNVAAIARRLDCARVTVYKRMGK